MLLKIGGSLLAAWLTLGWNVRKARKAFEAELRKEGISKKDAEKISKNILILKNEMLSMAKNPLKMRRKDKTS